MKLLKQKTAYIYKERTRGFWTVMFSHAYFRITKHTLDRNSLPVLYFKEITEDVKDFLKDYKLIYRKPRAKTIRSLQWTLFLDLFLTEKLIMLADKPYGTPCWSEAVDIYWNCLWYRSGVKLIEPEQYEKYRGLTAAEIQALLVIQANNISLN